MKRFILMLLVTVLLCGCGSSYTYKGEEPEFRSTEWGMIKEEVIQAEGKDPNLDEDNNITYVNQKFENLDVPVVIEYVFDNNGKLEEASYQHIAVLNENATPPLIMLRKSWIN